MVRYAVVGYGNMGSAHAAALSGNCIPGAVLTCVCDNDTGRLNKAKALYGDSVCLYEDYERMLDEHKADAVLIATPHSLHPAIAVAAFGKGWHVLTEKPAGVDAGAAMAMNDAAAKSGKAFGIMFNQRTEPVYTALKRYMELELLGEIKRSVWIINNWYRTQAYYDSATWRSTWRGEGGGVLLNQCPHNLDLWQWLVGMPVRVSAHCKNGHFHRIAVEDDATIYTEYENGSTGVFIASTGEYPGTNRLEISGTMGKAVVEKGKLFFELSEQDERILRSGDADINGLPETKSITLEFAPAEDGHINILRNFTRHITEGEKLIAPGEDGVKSLMISNAAYLSSWLSKEIDIPADNGLFTDMLGKQKDIDKDPDHGIESGRTTGTDGYVKRWQVNW